MARRRCVAGAVAASCMLRRSKPATPAPPVAPAPSAGVGHLEERGAAACSPPRRRRRPPPPPRLPSLLVALSCPCVCLQARLAAGCYSTRPCTRAATRRQQPRRPQQSPPPPPQQPASHGRLHLELQGGRLGRLGRRGAMGSCHRPRQDPCRGGAAHRRRGGCSCIGLRCWCTELRLAGPPVAAADGRNARLLSTSTKVGSPTCCSCPSFPPLLLPAVRGVSPLPRLAD